MAKASVATNPAYYKVCPHCGVGWSRPHGHALLHFERKKFCTRACANAAAKATSPVHDLTGKVFDRWTVVGLSVSPAGRKKWWWDCLCTCGQSGCVEDSSLKSGNSRSCGCLQREASACAGQASVTHGMTKSAPEYYVWTSMKQRCLNRNVRNWADYGGRGITVCDRWRDSFEAFFADMGPRPSPKHSIDRINNDEGYHPSNCRWSKLDDQVRNRRSNIIVTVGGVDMVLVDAARMAGVKYTTARMRYKKGWPIEKVLEPIA